MLKFLPVIKGCILEEKALTSQPNLIVKNSQRLCYVQLDLDILFVKLTARIGYYI